MARFVLALLSLFVGASSVDARPQPPQLPQLAETLATEREFGGVRWPAGTTLYFHAETKALERAHVTRLAAPWKVGGVIWPVDTGLELNARGEVRRAGRTLTAAEAIGGLRWPAGTGLAFDGSGRIDYAERRSVAGEQVGGFVFPAGAKLRFNADGKLRWASVQCNDEVFASVRWKPTTQVQVSEEGHVSALRTLAASETIGKVRWPAGTTLVLDQRGEVQRGGIAVRRPLRFGGVLWPEHTNLQVTADGKVTEASITSLHEPTVIHGKRYEAHLWIYFDPATGKVKGAEDPRIYE